MKHKRFLSLLLVFCMLFFLTAVTAFAEDPDDDLIDIVEEPEEVETVSAPVTAGEPELWVYGVQVTEANASDILGDHKVSYDFATNTLTFTAKPTATALHNGAMIDAENMDLTIVMPAKGLSLSSKTAKILVNVVGGALTVNGNLNASFLQTNAGEVCIYADNGLTVNGNLTLDAYDCEDGFGVKAMNGPVTVTGTVDIMAAETGIYCGNGDVTVEGACYIGCNSEATEGFCPSSCIYTANGGVDLNSFELVFGVASYAIYANGPVTVHDDLKLDNTQAGMAGGYGIYSTRGGIVCEKSANIKAGSGSACLNACDAPEGITINGNATLTNGFSSVSIAAISAAGGPINVAGNLTVNGYGENVVNAKGDIIIGGYADIKAQTYDSNGRRSNVMRSDSGSISIQGYLKTTGIGLGVYAYKDLTVNGNATLSGCLTGAQDYLLKAETGAVSIGGNLTTTGMADWVVYGGTGITVNGEVSIVSKASATATNVVQESNGMYSGGNICFNGGKADIDVYQTALSAKDGFVFLPGYGVTLPAGGRAVLLDGVYTVTEADKTTVAAHVIISDEVTLEDGFYLMRPDWTAFAINPAEVFETNPENTNEYMLSTTLNVGDEIKVVRVENGAVTGWWPDGEGTQYTVDEAHAGAKTVYFKTSYDSAWSEFGGYFYIEGTAAPTGYHINVTDYTKGVAVTSIETETLYTGEVTFTVSSGADDKAVGVAVLNADGTLTRLACTTADGVHSFTVTVEDADVTVVLIFKGDFDLNGRVQSKDSTLLKQTLVGLKELDPETAALQIFAVDLNNDGKIQNKEGTMISQVLVDNSSYAW